MNCWKILGLAPTHNKRDIKRAYATLLKSHHPEDDPEGFQRIHQAYQDALQWEGDVAEVSPMFPSEGAEPDESGDTQDAESRSVFVERTEHANQEDAEISADNTAAESQHQGTQVNESLQYEEFLNVQKFVENLHALLADPDMRKDEGPWRRLLNQVDEGSLAFKQQASFQVFEAFSTFLPADGWATQSTDIPEFAIPEFAQVFDWRADELNLAQHFSADEMDRVSTFAFGSTEQAVIEPPQTGRLRFWQHLRTFGTWALVIWLMVKGFDLLLEDKTQRQAAEAEASEKQLAAAFDACDRLSEPAPHSDLDTCLELAEQGWPQAQKKLSWLYATESDYQDWQQAFDWVQRAAKQDKEAQLISNIMLFSLGNDEEDKLTGEQGIKSLANIGFAPAQAYLAVTYYLKTNQQPRTINQFWLLEKAHQHDPQLVSAYDLATILANGFDTQVNLKKATKVLQQEAQRNFPTSYNNVAWFLATLDDNPFTDSNYPVSLAESVINDPQYADHYAYVDTLAATYATHQDFERAVETQQRAIEVLQSVEGYEERLAEEMEGFRERLAQYQNAQRVILSALNPDRESFFSGMQRALERRLMRSMKYAARSQP